MNNSMQDMHKTLTFAKLSLLSITLAGLFTSVHHLYRFGFGFFIPAIIIIFLPYVLFRWFKHTRNKIVLSAYGLFNLFVIFWLGLIDGGLDHALRVFNNYVLAPLYDGVPPLKLDFRMLPPTKLAGNFFYEITGILCFVASLFATYYLNKFLRDKNRTTF
jgi:hypothetical protein